MGKESENGNQMNTNVTFEPANGVGFRTGNEISRMCRDKKRVITGQQVLEALTLGELAEILAETDKPSSSLPPSE